MQINLYLSQFPLHPENVFSQGKVPFKLIEIDAAARPDLEMMYFQ